jgi:hypothetical protein
MFQRTSRKRAFSGGRSPTNVAFLCLLASTLHHARAFGPLPPSFWHPSSIDPAATEIKPQSYPPPFRTSTESRPEASVPMPPPRTVKDILALDFDGVLCNSVEESSQAAFRSVKKMWPQLATYCAPVGGASANECPGWLSDRCVDWDVNLHPRKALESKVHGFEGLGSFPK